MVKVQRVQAPGAEHLSWLVFDDSYLPISPILAFLKVLYCLGRSHRTIRTTVYHLKLFRGFLRDEKLSWTDSAVAYLVTVLLPSPAVRRYKTCVCNFRRMYH